MATTDLILVISSSRPNLERSFSIVQTRRRRRKIETMAKEERKPRQSSMGFLLGMARGIMGFLLRMPLEKGITRFLLRMVKEIMGLLLQMVKGIMDLLVQMVKFLTLEVVFPGFDVFTDCNATVTHFK